MNQRLKGLLDEARQLTREEQLELVRLLLNAEADSQAPDDVDAAWAEEAGRRWEQHKSSGAGTHDAGEAIDYIRKRLARRRSR